MEPRNAGVVLYHTVNRKIINMDWEPVTSPVHVLLHLTVPTIPQGGHYYYLHLVMKTQKHGEVK